MLYKSGCRSRIERYLNGIPVGTGTCRNHPFELINTRNVNIRPGIGVRTVREDGRAWTRNLVPYPAGCAVA